MQSKTLGQFVTSDAAARLMEFRDAVARAYPNAVQDVVLFGSQVRGDAGPDSDYDVAVVLATNVTIDRELRRRLADAAWEHVIDGYAIIPIAMEAHTLGDDCPTRTELGARITAEGISVR